MKFCLIILLIFSSYYATFVKGTDRQFSFRTNSRGVLVWDPYKFYKYGCYFDSNYDVEKPFEGITPRIFGNKTDYSTFKETDHVITWIKKVTKQYGDFIETEVYNNVDVLSECYSRCRSGGHGNLEVCIEGEYISYNPSFSLLSESSGLAVRWLDRLKIKFATYLVYSQLKPFKGTCNLGEDKCDPCSVAVFMPFEVNNKHGFVLFDPGFIQEKPVLVIDDNTEEYKKLNEVTKGDTAMTTAWSDAGDIFHYELDDSIIIGYPTAPTLREGSIPIRDDDNDQKIVYHFEEPFCSFLSSSVKPSIFSPKKMIVRRNRKGQVTAALSTFFDQNNTNPRIILEYHDKQLEEIEENVYILEIPMGNVRSVIGQLQYKDFMKLLSKRLRMEPNKLQDTIIKLAEMFNNSDFLKNMNRLTKRYGVDFPDRGEFWGSRGERPIFLNLQNVDGIMENVRKNQQSPKRRLKDINNLYSDARFNHDSPVIWVLYNSSTQNYKEKVSMGYECNPVKVENPEIQDLDSVADVLNAAVAPEVQDAVSVTAEAAGAAVILGYLDILVKTTNLHQNTKAVQRNKKKLKENNSQLQQSQLKYHRYTAWNRRIHYI